MKHLLIAVFLSFASIAMAAGPDDILVIEVAGETTGQIQIELHPDLAPKHVEQIKTLARDGYYDGVAFHRVIDRFMAQTGDGVNAQISQYDPRRAGTGGSQLPNIEQEFSDTPFVTGTVGMARSQDPNSANSQFFIMFEPAPHLDGQYTVVGTVIAGQEVVDAIKRGDARLGGAVVEAPDYMQSVYIKGDR